MVRRLLVALCALAVLASAAAVSADPPRSPVAAPQRQDLTKVVSVLPPGQNGFAYLDVPGGGTVAFGEHFIDQLEMYADLVFEEAIGEDRIPEFFKDDDFNTVADPAKVERVEVVGSDARIFRDRFGVPHVYGDTAEAVAYGAGYVTAEDRMFEADLFRHAARGTLAEFLGPDYLAYDEVLRRDGYTEAELAAQLAALPAQFGENGTRIARGLEAFAAGFSQRVAEVLANPTLMPVEYVGTGNLPVPWRSTDTVALSVLLSRTFGEAAGAEVRNAALYQGLRARLGSDEEARKAFDDLRWLNDPVSPTTVPVGEGLFTYPNTGAPNPDAIAIPDHAAEVYRGQVEEVARVGQVLGGLALPQAASNAMLIGPSESATGNSLQLGDPQVQYSVPQYLMEISLHGGGYDAAGMTFPGVSALVLIGHGVDYAWTVTSGISDAVDVRAERLCDPEGGTPTLESSHYLYKGVCRAMEERVETILVKNSAPPVVDPDAPELDAAAVTVQRTVHGPVFARDTVEGAPVALVKERAFWGRELDNAAAFGAFNFPDLIRSAEDFGEAASNIVVSLNLYYADRDTVAYWHTGRYPVRAQGVETRLPTWGDGEWEWNGNIPFTEQPQFVSSQGDPATRDYTYNWNNKPAKGWANGDDTNWGEIHRVDALVSQMDAALAGAGTMDRLDVINMMNSAATVDPRVAKLLPLLVPRTDPDPVMAHALSVIEAWAAEGPAPGAHRIDRDNDGFYDRGNAIRIWDAWNERLVENIFFDEIGDLRGLLGVGVVDQPGPGGSAYFDGMFNHVLHVLDPTPSLAPRRAWLNGEPEIAVVMRSLAEALHGLGLDSIAEIDALRMPREEIVFTSFGAHSEIKIHWVNRGTWTHIAEVTGRRA